MNRLTSLRVTILALTTALTACLLTPAHGLTVNGTGFVTDWNLKPFTQPNGTTVADGVTSIRSNNISPINFGGGTGNTPSGGEGYDLEELHIRNYGNLVQVLLVTSSYYQVDGQWNLGDLMLSAGNTDPRTTPFTLALATRTHDGFVAGQLYENITTNGLQTGSGSYGGNNAIEIQVHDTLNQKAATFLQTGSAVGSATTVLTVSYNYGTISGKNENSTWLYEFSFTLPTAVSDLGVQLAYGCGNDVIRGNHTMTTPNHAVPEAATLVTGITGLVSLGLTVTRRRRHA